MHTTLDIVGGAVAGLGFFLALIFYLTRPADMYTLPVTTLTEEEVAEYKATLASLEEVYKRTGETLDSLDS